MQSPILKTQYSSSQLQQTRFNHIHKLDKYIRQKWNYIFHYRKGRVPNVNPEEQEAFFRLKSQPSSIPVYKCNMDAHKIQAIKTDLLRKNTHHRKKRNEEIFYRKKSCEFRRDKSKEKKLSVNLSCQLKHKNLINFHKKDGASCLPYMLRPRKEYIEKQMNIIDQDYQTSLLRIKSKQDLKASLNHQQKIKMIGKMKGSKIYYQLMKECYLPQLNSSDNKN